MTTWYDAETPFGRIAFAVSPTEETLTVEPIGGYLKPYTDPVTHQTNPSILDVPRGALTINGKAYADRFRVSWNAGRTFQGAGGIVNVPAHASVASGLTEFSESAYAKLGDWFTANWAQLATPLRKARAVHAQALYEAIRSGEEFDKWKKAHEARLEVLGDAAREVVKLQSEAARAATADKTEEN